MGTSNVATADGPAYINDAHHHSIMMNNIIVNTENAMRISKEAAAENKARVVKAAGRLIREKGFEGFGVAEVMREAGLTHGGFYNHFESKEDLGVAAICEAFDAAIARLHQRFAEAPGRAEALKHYVERYLSERVRDNPGLSCPMASLGTEAARYEQALKAEFADGVECYLEAFASVLGGSEEKRAEAIVISSALIGALTLARACAGTKDALSSEIMSVIREYLLNRSASSGPL
jgi:TetR/AcrR family transcriptional repressor of nem operon